MTRSLKGIMTAAALFAVAACSDAAPTEPASFAPEVEARAAKPSGNFTFSVNQSNTQEQPFSSSGGTGRINFAGSMFTGTPCYDVTGSSSTSGGTVTVTVSAASNTTGGCIQVITYNNYSGAVSGLAAGTYTLNIVHQRGTTSEVAYTSTVTVN